LSECAGITDLTPLSNLIRLRTIDVYCCHGVNDLSPLHALSKLRRVDLSFTAVETLQGIETALKNGCTLGPSGLYPGRHCEIEDCSKLVDVSSLAECPPFEFVRLNNVPLSFDDLIQVKHVIDSAKVLVFSPDSPVVMGAVDIATCWGDNEQAIADHFASLGVDFWGDSWWTYGGDMNRFSTLCTQYEASKKVQDV
jgi:hypothetical protein